MPHHHDDVFADTFAQRRNFATGVDARLKIAFTAAALVLNILSPGIVTPLAIAAFAFAVLLAIHIPWRLLLLRLAMPLVMAAVVLLAQIFFYGATPLFTISIGGWAVSGYTEGLARGLLIMGRVIAGVSLILFLSLSTPANRLLLAAGWYRVPRVFTELALLTYRYIFVLIEEAAGIREAQKVRLGYHGWRQAMHSLGTLGGSLILRAYDRAGRVFESMTARGYTGAIPAAQAGFARRDRLAAVVMAALLLVFYLAGLV